MGFLEVLRLVSLTLSVVRMFKDGEGDKESALLGLGTVIAKASGAKDEEIEVVIPELKVLIESFLALLKR